jgi:hypothetical protein
MELSALSENIIPVPWERGSQSLELQVNIDAFTPAFWRQMKARAEEKFRTLEAEIKKAVAEASMPEVKGVKKPQKLTRAQKAKEAEREFAAQVKEQLDSLEGRARQLEAERETNVEFLVPHVLKDWDVVDQGIHILPTREVLIGLPPPLVQDLFDTCAKAAKTVKKRVDEEDAETSEGVQHGSSGLRAVGGSGLSG